MLRCVWWRGQQTADWNTCLPTLTCSLLISNSWHGTQLSLELSTPTPPPTLITTTITITTKTRDTRLPQHEPGQTHATADQEEPGLGRGKEEEGAICVRGGELGPVYCGSGQGQTRHHLTQFSRNNNINQRIVITTVLANHPITPDIEDNGKVENDSLFLSFFGPSFISLTNNTLAAMELILTTEPSIDLTIIKERLQTLLADILLSSRDF